MYHHIIRVVIDTRMLNFSGNFKKLNFYQYSNFAKIYFSCALDCSKEYLHFII